MGKTVAAIVVTYNRKALLIECIKALKEQTYSDFVTLIIDNASTDGTKEAIAEFIDNTEVFYFNTGENLGGAGGFNFGIKQAVNMNFDYCWVMDDDTIASARALEALMETVIKLKDEFSFLCSSVKWIDGSDCIMNLPELSKDSAGRESTISNGLVLVDSCSFVSCFFKSGDVRKLGLPIKEFFIYGDDVEFTKRLRTLGSAYQDKSSVVVHKMNTNQGASLIEVSADRIDRYFYSYRNKIYVAKRISLVKVVKKLGRAVQDGIVILSKAKDKKILRLAVLIKGTVWGLFFSPKIEKP